jgi:hypothetical protein
MSQSITLDRLQPAPQHDLGTNALESVIPVQGDFARGQRRGSVAVHARADFATGMRNASIARVTGDFASGMRTSPRTTMLGDFATGMRTNSAPIARNRFRSPAGALPLAA